MGEDISIYQTGWDILTRIVYYRLAYWGVEVKAK